MGNTGTLTTNSFTLFMCMCASASVTTVDKNIQEKLYVCRVQNDGTPGQDAVVPGALAHTQGSSDPKQRRVRRRAQVLVGTLRAQCNTSLARCALVNLVLSGKTWFERGDACCNIATDGAAGTPSTCQVLAVSPRAVSGSRLDWKDVSPGENQLVPRGALKVGNDENGSLHSCRIRDSNGDWVLGVSAQRCAVAHVGYLGLFIG